MPWKVSYPVSERMRFVTALEQGERMTDACRQFGISRKTGYTIWQRYQQLGPLGLYDFARRPERSPRRTSAELGELLLEAKRKHPTWGPKKLRAWLSRTQPDVRLPAASTIGSILKRHGLVKPRRRPRRSTPYPCLLQTAVAPNDVWCADFKGQFRLGNGRYCYPLTISDLHTRYLIGCEALENTKTKGAQAVFELAFRQYGLPRVIRTDNGVPFASQGAAGLSRLSAWWLRLGILPERIEPAHPEQNGAHERMHLTLKQDTTRPAARNVLQQQERFDRFIEVYNNDRPHEALDQCPPGDFYVPSDRRLPKALPWLSYPMHDAVRTVTSTGYVWIPGKRRTKRIFVSAALVGQPVGLREIDPGRWLVSFINLDLGLLDVPTSRFTPFDDPWSSPGLSSAG